MATVKIVAAAIIFALAVWAGYALVDYGYDRSRIDVERQNNDAARDADDDRLSFDDCPERMWDFGAGECRRAP